MTWDNACYRLETSFDLDLTHAYGRDHCKKQYNSELVVLNSKDEATFIKGYLTGLKVITLGF